jgi:hypothetical protein
VLGNPLLSSRDVHAALLNATAKNAHAIVKELLPKASERSANACLAIACKLANVDLIKALLPKASQTGQVRHASAPRERQKAARECPPRAS